MNKFALIGYPLGHSISAAIHKAGFESLGVEGSYEILETPPEDLVARIKQLKCNDYNGFNVTIPLKLPVALFVQDVDKYADIAGAVNTIKINSDKTLSGFNTDVLGFKKAIPNDIILNGKSVGVLGTGGACRAAVLALTELGVTDIGLFTRNIPNSLDTLQYLRRKFPKTEFNTFQIEHIRDLSKYAMLVNTTPIGMQGRSADLMPIEVSALRTLKEDAVVYDVIYNPKKTLLLKNAENLGLRTLNGLDMFIYQAANAEEIWLGRTPDINAMKIAALENL